MEQWSCSAVAVAVAMGCGSMRAIRRTEAELIETHVHRASERNAAREVPYGGKHMLCKGCNLVRAVRGDEGERCRETD